MCPRCGRPEILLGDYCENCWHAEYDLGQQALTALQNLVDAFDAGELDSRDILGFVYLRAINILEKRLKEVDGE